MGLERNELIFIVAIAVICISVFSLGLVGAIDLNKETIVLSEVDDPEEATVTPYSELSQEQKHQFRETLSSFDSELESSEWESGSVISLDGEYYRVTSETRLSNLGFISGLGTVSFIPASLILLYFKGVSRFNLHGRFSNRQKNTIFAIISGLYLIGLIIGLTKFMLPVYAVEETTRAASMSASSLSEGMYVSLNDIITETSSKTSTDQWGAYVGETIRTNGETYEVSKVSFESAVIYLWTTPASWFFALCTSVFFAPFVLLGIMMVFDEKAYNEVVGSSS